jgi:hypothetical protein
LTPTPTVGFDPNANEGTRRANAVMIETTSSAKYITSINLFMAMYNSSAPYVVDDV